MSDNEELSPNEQLVALHRKQKKELQGSDLSFICILLVIRSVVAVYEMLLA